MKSAVIHFLRRLRTFLLSPVISIIEEKEQTTHTLLQNALFMQYRRMLETGKQMPKLNEVGFSVYSESDEDGILHYIFAVIGSTNKKLVDIGAATIRGSNTANLIINYGWTGLLIDGDSSSVEACNKFYSCNNRTKIYPPHYVCAWVNAENIDRLLIENGLTGEVDLLCIDIDGIDYWVWKAINCISPRVVVVEYQCIWGAEKSVTVPDKQDFQAAYSNGFGIYCGASLSAFVKLGKEKDYRLVGCQRYGYNAFFVRNDIGKKVLPEISAAECFEHSFTHWARKSFLERIQNKEWIEV
jgi:hypothetical protein